MKNETPQARGYSLFSGGLDSSLAVLVLREQGVLVEGIVFESPFFKVEGALKAAELIDLPLHIINFTADILALVADPPHGFGAAMNPCIDCHAMMIRRAGELMRANGFDFVATGEVLNQRPMSQNRRALGMVAKSSGLAGRLLRPLSALLLEPTLPETEGLIQRERLLALNGRNRKPQIELAARYGLQVYPSPAGGCLLTEQGFCRKLADLRDHEGLHDHALARSLNLGRHFRLPTGAKCIVGRNSSENAVLRAARKDQDIVVQSVSVPGPTVLLLGGSADAVHQAAQLCVAYADNKGQSQVVVRIEGAGQHERTMAVVAREMVRAWLV